MCNVSTQSPFKTEEVCGQASLISLDLFVLFVSLAQKAVSKPYKERLRDVTQVAENPSQVQMVEH